jgi:hypothetical protein
MLARGEGWHAHTVSTSDREWVLLALLTWLRGFAAELGVGIGIVAVCGRSGWSLSSSTKTNERLSMRSYLIGAD